MKRVIMTQGRVIISRLGIKIMLSSEHKWFRKRFMLLDFRKLTGVLVELRYCSFTVLQLSSQKAGNKLLLFILLDLCPVSRCLCLVIGLPAREWGWLWGSLLQTWHSSGARAECSVGPIVQKHKQEYLQSSSWDTSIQTKCHRDGACSSVHRNTVTWYCKAQ